MAQISSELKLLQKRRKLNQVSSEKVALVMRRTLYKFQTVEIGGYYSRRRRRRYQWSCWVAAGSRRASHSKGWRLNRFVIENNSVNMILTAIEI